jgi:hypothetical protein
MRRRILILPLIASAAGLMAFALPASADTAGTPATFAITGGALTITAPTASVPLGSVASSVDALSVSAPLGTVTVTDARGGLAGWTTTAIANDFATAAVDGPVQTIPATDASYTSPTATKTGTVTVTAASLSSLATAGAVQTATSVSGNNTAAWNPTVAVAIPANAVAGTYSSTITHSVS